MDNNNFQNPGLNPQETNSQQQQPFTPTEVPQMPNVNTMPPEKSHNKVGVLAAVLVIILLFAAAALYIFNSQKPTATPLSPNVINSGTETASTETTELPAVTPVTNTASDPQSLMNDLNAATAGLDEQNF